MKILLVDDSETIIEVLPDLLKTKGHLVATARDGKEALESLKNWKPDLVLADLVMPGLDGFGLLRELQADYELAKIPVVVMTGRRLDGSTQKMMEQEPNVIKVFLKPVDERTLTRFLEEQQAKLGAADHGMPKQGFISDAKDFDSYYPSMDLDLKAKEEQAKKKPQP